VCRNPSWFYALMSKESSFVLKVGGSSLGRGFAKTGYEY
jgi:hypothetical protein